MKDTLNRSYNLIGATNDSNLAILYSLLVMALATLLVIRIIKFWDKPCYESRAHSRKGGKIEYFIVEKHLNLFYVPIHGVYSNEADAISKLNELNARHKTN
jgi:hypothetical protein